VLVAADTPQAVLEWLERHNQHADAMFRVPRDDTQATGVPWDVGESARSGAGLWPTGLGMT
jgi:hypothetical protein